MDYKMLKTWVTTNDLFTDDRVIQSGEVFVPSTNKYPHIHIGKNFVTFSASPTNHIYLCEGDMVYGNRIDNVLAGRPTRDLDPINQVCQYIRSQFA